MSLMLDMIAEEARRNQLMQQEYINRINHLPKGSLVTKKVGNHEYYYLKYREEKKTVTDYIGRDMEKVEEVSSQLDKRKHFERMLRDLMKEYKIIMKATGGVQ